MTWYELGGDMGQGIMYQRMYFLTKICSKIYVLRRNMSKTTLRIFSAKEMGGTPKSAKDFWAEWFSVKGGIGLPPNSTKEKIHKKSIFG